MCIPVPSICDSDLCKLLEDVNISWAGGVFSDLSWRNVGLMSTLVCAFLGWVLRRRWCI